jgi:hypothetical protein
MGWMAEKQEYGQKLIKIEGIEEPYAE